MTFAYWQKTLGHWFGYVWPYFCIALIVNGVLIYLVAGDERGVLGVAGQVISDGSAQKGALYILAFVFLGPLINLYTTIVAIKSAVEADDDYHYYLDELRHLPTPLASTRKRLIAVLSFVTGLMLLPFTFWLYTAQLNWLWGYDLPFFVQPGLLLSIGLIVLGYAIVPRLFPSIAKALYDLESKISDKLTES